MEKIDNIIDKIAKGRQDLANLNFMMKEILKGKHFGEDQMAKVIESAEQEVYNLNETINDLRKIKELIKSVEESDIKLNKVV